ncbi:MAG: LysR family substrate-binding domain-containing protein [Prochloraceae cyanobacterium]
MGANLILKGDRIDLGFLHPPIRDRDGSLNLQFLREDFILVLLPASHPLAEQEKVSIASLADKPIIIYPREKGPILYEQFLQLSQTAGFVPKIVQEVEMTQTRLGLVAAGVGISFILSSSQNLTMKGVVCRSLLEEFPKLELAIAWQKNNSSRVLQQFIKLARKPERDP